MEISSPRRRAQRDASATTQSPISNLQSPLSPRGEKLALLLLLGVAFFLRFYCLTCSSYWHDEGNTWALVQRSFAQIAADAAADIHPPGYYWLLKLWSIPFGHSPFALRAFSALAGTLTVAVVYGIAYCVLRIPSRVAPNLQSPISNLQSPLPLLAALLAAVNPFQIYSSQEARMYGLLMLESAALVWVGLQVAGGRGQGAGRGRMTTDDRRPTTGRDVSTHSPFTIHHLPFTILFALLATLGLWTHYIFPVILAGVGFAYLWQWMSVKTDGRRQTTDDERSPISQSPNLPISFLLANLSALLLYLPWLPTAIDRVLHWPAGGAAVGAMEGLRLTLETLAVGPIRTGPDLAWPWLALVGLLPLLGLWRIRRNPAAPFLALWLLASIGVMFGLGLFTDSFLKFLLVASPAWCVLAACCVLRTPYLDSRRDTETQRESLAARSTQPISRFTFHASRLIRYASIATTYAIRTTQYALALLALLLAFVTLPPYYADPAARDNYAGMAATVAALGDAATDGVILTAPGQADVWAIYDPGLPLLALPEQRPADRAQTESALANFAQNREQLFALFWATEQADPDGIVEGWLNRHAFKGLESWQGNVRFIHYSLPNQLACEELTPPAPFGDAISLTRICLPPERAVVAGTALPVALHWQTIRPIERRYKVSLQLLNDQNQVVGQQDGEPGGGALPTNGWQPNTEIVDKRGLYAPIGAPPVGYRLIVALYDSETGARLPTPQGDALTLAEVTVQRPARPLPPEIAPARFRLDQPVGPLRLAGYDAYAKGYAHDPERPVAPGELLHLTLYWQAPNPLPADWPADLHFTLSLSDAQVRAPLAGPGFPTAAWRAGDCVRADVDIPYRADGRLTLTVGNESIPLGRVAGGRVR